MIFKKWWTKADKEDVERGLQKTKEGLWSRLRRSVLGKDRVDDALLDQLEEALIEADVGVDTTVEIIQRLEQRIAREKYLSTDELHQILIDEIGSMLKDPPVPHNEVRDTPYVLLIVGVNGVGKTTTIGKLAYRYIQQGKTVLMGAADTFRAAAIDQLKIWAQRTGAQFYAKQMGADPAAVAYEAVQHALQHHIDVVLIDTAGRLHNKSHLMRELSKIRKAVHKAKPGAPHEVLLVLDATTGQNAFEQCKQFSEVTDVTGLVLTKLDGTAKGGVVIGLSHQFDIPIQYIGVGEQMEALKTFDKRSFLEALFSPQRADV